MIVSKYPPMLQLLRLMQHVFAAILQTLHRESSAKGMQKLPRKGLSTGLTKGLTMSLTQGLIKGLIKDSCFV